MIWLEAHVVERFIAMRRPGESYSDVILRLVEIEAGNHAHDLWVGVESALHKAQFHLNEASRSLQRPERTAMSVVLESTGTIVVKRWEEPFYAHVDSFLVEARSVSNVIESCFGHDKARRT